MNNNILRISKDPVPNLNVSLLELDMDEKSEVVFVMERATGKTIGYATRPPSGIYKLVLDVRFAVDPLVLVGILDNDLQYNAAVADGVKLQLVDGNAVNLSQ